MAGKWWVILFILLGFSSYGQYVYTYTDPCTGILNSVTINQPSGSVTLFYAGQYNTFTQSQLQAGAFEDWVAQVNALAPPGSNPCAGAGGSLSTGSNTNTGTNTATNVSSIIGIATGISGNLGGSAASTGTGGISTNTGSNGSSSNNDNGNGSSGSNSSGSTSTGGSSTGGSGSSSGGGNNTSTGGGSGSTGGSGGSGSTGSGGSTGGGSTGGSGGQSGDNSGTGIGGGGEAGGVDTGTNTGGTTEGSGTSEGAVGGNESTTTASGGDSESGGDGGGGGGSKRKSKQEKVGRGSLIGAGDFVIIRNGSDIKATGMDNFKFNTSITHINTKQNFIKGANLNYTTGENTANLTLYGSYKTETFMGIFSNSTMSNFKSDIFNTTTALGAQRLWKFTFMAGTNLTFGKIGESDFQNWSIVGGAFTNFSGSKVFSANVMAIGIYSPYIFYYEGQWYKSGILIVPLANCDFKITDKFKWSVSFSGAYQYQADILNFQLSTGTKILL